MASNGGIGFQEGYLAMFNRWFLHDDLLLSLPVAFHYSVALVLLSYLVAAFGAYTSFQLIERVHAARTVRARRAWLVTAGFAMGCGIWTMHFIAMLAVVMPTMRHRYYAPAKSFRSKLSLPAPWPRGNPRPQPRRLSRRLTRDAHRYPAA